MRACLQRVTEASVKVDGEVVGSIGAGLLILIGFEKGDDRGEMVKLRDKILNLRIFRGEEQGKHFDKSVQDVSGSVLIVSQFTLAGNCEKGRRPDFSVSMPPVEAKSFYEEFISLFEAVMVDGRVACGIFGADMKVNLVNDGPVTFVI